MYHGGMRVGGKSHGWWVAVMVWVLGCPMAPAAQPSDQPLVFGANLELGGSQNAQFKALFEQVARAMERDLHLKVNYRYYVDKEELKEDLAARIPAFSFMYLTDGRAVKGYVPMMTISVYDSPFYQYCFFVNKANKAKAVEDLRGLPLMTYGYADGYYSMRRLIGEDPLGFFGKVRITESVFSSFLALSMGQAEVIYATDIGFKHLKRTNPGAVKKLRRLACAEEGLAYSPVMVRDDLPPELVKRVRGYYLTLDQQKNIGAMTSVMDLTGFHFIPHDPANDDTRRALMKEAADKGWEAGWRTFQNATARQD